ncbi:hypothetical protein QBZ16_004990 [Prototheca wickerhamii]|uniref:NAD(+) kinase n=1 Tax=Prototheca wickerhamii TaxID=3111 RepID=A0AAD9MMQ3_PROWI|nr:hypothetical protein QBZ16_004990 [Prototheca wickerhamii]
MDSLSLERERVRELERQLAQAGRPPAPVRRAGQAAAHLGRHRSKLVARRHSTPASPLAGHASEEVAASLLLNANLQERLARQCQELEKLRGALAEVEAAQQERRGQAAVGEGKPGPEAMTLSRLWEMLDRAVNLQRETLSEVAEAVTDEDSRRRQGPRSPPADEALGVDAGSPSSSFGSSEGEEEQEVALADDGSAGVGATAAAAVSVALAQSWAATARHTALHGGAASVAWTRASARLDAAHVETDGPDGVRESISADSLAEDAPDGAPSPAEAERPPRQNGRPALVRRDPRSETSKRLGYGRARFKLVAAVPRARRAREGGTPVPLSALPSRLTLLPTESHVALDSLAEADRAAMDDAQEAEWRACGSHLKLQWLSPPRSVLVACKPSEVEAPHTVRAVLWLLSRGLTVWIEPSEHGRSLEALLRVLRPETNGGDEPDDAGCEDECAAEAQTCANTFKDDKIYEPARRACSYANPAISAASFQQLVGDDASSSGSSGSLATAPAGMDELARGSAPACGLSSRRLAAKSRSGVGLVGRPPLAPGPQGLRTLDPCDIDLDTQLRTWTVERPWREAAARVAAAEDPERARASEKSSSATADDSILSAPDGPTPLPPAVAAAIDLVVSLGGDGTLLWACGLFGDGAVPPIVSFAMGSLGFMTPFPATRIATVLGRVCATAHGFPLMLRHRLQGVILRASCGRGAPATPCQSPPLVVLNELVIDRGTAPFLTNLHVYADGAFVTVVQGDGLILATPTGSTAYSLAAGGSMVHPGVPCLLFTPICPHTLSSRPLVFPEHVTITVMVPRDSRAGAYVSFDGKHRARLAPGDGVAGHAESA